MVAQGDLQQGPAGQGLPDQPVLPALRDGPVGPRDGPAGCLPHGDRTGRDGAVPAVDRARRRHCAAGRGGSAGVDHHALDPGFQHRRGRAPRRKLRGGAPGGRPGCRGGSRATDAPGARRRLARRGQAARVRPGRGDVPATVQPGGHPRSAPGGARNVRDHRGRDWPGAHVTRVRRGRHGDQPGARAAGGQPGPAGRPVRGTGAAGRRAVLQGRR